MKQKVNIIQRKSKSFINPQCKSEGTALRREYIEDLRLAGYSAGAVWRYTHVMVKIASHFGKSPIHFTDEELREYFKYLKEGKNLAPISIAVEHAALKFFYTATYPKAIKCIQIYKTRLAKKIPAVLSVEEVRKILSHVKNIRCRTCLALIYSCGLRINEAVSLKVGDVDSARMLIHIKGGKGGKDRCVPLPLKTLKLLRELWKTHKHPEWLFPSRHKSGIYPLTGAPRNNHVSNAI